MTEVSESSVTRDRLVTAAGEVFAEYGFRNATVREICRRAGANVAAVNYYFRDKEELYQEVFRLAHCSAQRGELMDAMATLPAEERIGYFISGFLHELLAGGKPAWHGRLMAWEMVDPTAALGLVVQQSIRPKFAHLLGSVSELLGPGWPEMDIRYAASSVIAQCLFWKHCQPVIQTLYDDMQYTPEKILEIGEHVTRFTLMSLHGLKAAGPLKGERAE